MSLEDPDNKRAGGGDKPPHAQFMDPSKESLAMTRSGELVYHDKKWYQWKTGAFAPMSEAAAKAFVQRWFKGRYSFIDAGNVGSVLSLASGSAHHDEAEPSWRKQIALEPVEPPVDWRMSDCLRTPTQIINLKAMEEGRFESIPATPLLFSTTALPCDYDPQAGKPQRFLAYLNEALEGDQDRINLVLEYAGLCLTDDPRFQKCLFLFGPPRSGKGVFCNVLKGILGPQGYLGTNLKAMSREFGLAKFPGKKVVAIAEAKTQDPKVMSEVLEKIISIIGCDEVDINRKHLEALNEQLGTKFILSSNELPQFSDSARAMPSRVMFVRFPCSLMDDPFDDAATAAAKTEKRDKNLVDKILLEKHQIVTLLIDKLAELRRRGHFIEPDDSRDLKQMFSDIVSPETSFVRECCDLGSKSDPRYMTVRSRVYEVYRSWCDVRNLVAKSNNIFLPKLQEQFRLESKQVRINGAQERVFTGLRIRE